MIECQVCSEEFSDDDVGKTPRILTNCGHTLCEECAKSILVENQITCPFDRQVTAIGRTGIDGLPKNFSLLESLRGEDQTTKGTTTAGIPCAENSSHVAILFCQQCEVDLCEICFVRIHRLKVFSSHQRIHVSEKPVELPKCPVHPFSTAEFFCTYQHCEAPNKIMCQGCMTTGSHRFHEYDGLRELIEGNKTCRIPISFKYLQDGYEDFIGMYTEAIKKLDMTGEMFQKAEKAIIDTFDEGKKKALEDLRSLSERKTAPMKKVNNAFIKNLRTVNELRRSEKSPLKSIVEQVDVIRKWRQTEDNLAHNINKRVELYNFDGVGIFLPVLKLKFAKTGNEEAAFRDSGLVCIHRVTDRSRDN